MTYPQKPHFYERPPEALLKQHKQVAKVRLESDELVDVGVLLTATSPGERWYFESVTNQHEYDEHYLVRYLEWTIDNPRFYPELMAYNKALEAHTLRMAEYDRLMVIWNEQIAKDVEEAERAQYEKLKLKYEPKA